MTLTMLDTPRLFLEKAGSAGKTGGTFRVEGKQKLPPLFSDARVRVAVYFGRGTGGTPAMARTRDR